MLVEVKRHWRDIEVLDDGLRVRVQPGLTIAQVNAWLAPYGRRLGPDPSSSTACTIGGLVANNSSGKSCGTEFNAYHTLQSLKVVLPSGTVFDSAAPDADRALRAAEPDLHEGLLRLRRRILDNPASVRTIRHQFSMKNTLGYGLNAFLDYEQPAEILAHLMVGSEGTLGFVAGAVFHTVPVLPGTATGLLLFPDMRAACDSLEPLRDSEATCLELEAGHRTMARRMLRRLRDWTDDGRLPVVVDASSCTHGFADLAKGLDSEEDRAAFAPIRFVDAVAFAYAELLPHLDVTRRVSRVALHPTCSMHHLGLVDTLREVAAAFADTVDVPQDWRCCAYAGDRGLLHPELTASATHREAAEVTANNYDDHLSSNRTCEIGLTQATGHPYRSVLTALEEATRADRAAPHDTGH
ncbi:FAD-binding oxidoreductase [Streptomyces malaysiensis]|uniref:FAD-binding oxidoreductase n=1 Tax=Streptomyces malaysiensis TaxID=92644 RepID=UPI002B289610|nr:FAD-binding oxidoreductase [Streptomyces malaysiensis]